MSKQQLQQQQQPLIALYAPVSVICAVFGCGRTHVYSLLGAGKIHAVKSGKKTLVEMASARAHFESLPSARIKSPRQ
jgi:hypothetical protein